MNVKVILTEVNEEPAIALTLVLGKNHYTGNVVLLLAVLLLVEKREKLENNGLVR